MNYIKNDRYDPLQYNSPLDDFHQYSKYRKDYRLPKNAKYNINSTVIYKPRNCEVTKWSNWSTCSKKCDGGITRRERMILKPPKYGGAKCPILKQLIYCNNQPCIPTNAIRYKTSYYIKNYWGSGSYMASCGYTNSCRPFRNLSVSTYKNSNNSYLKTSPNWSRWKLVKYKTNINQGDNGPIYYNDIVKIYLEANNYMLVPCSRNSCNSYAFASVSVSSPNGQYVKIIGDYLYWKIVSTTGKTGIVEIGDKLKIINLGNNSYLNTCGYSRDCGSGKLYAINTAKQNTRDSSLDVSNWSFEK